VEKEEDKSAHMSFVGLPTPAAAGVIVSLVILHQEILPSLNVIIYTLPFCALGTGVLMVSRIRYPHILNQYLRGKKPLIVYFYRKVIKSKMQLFVRQFILDRPKFVCTLLEYNNGRDFYE